MKKIVKKYWLLILITITIIALGIFVLIHFCNKRAATIGSVAGACGGILAVVWFFAALKSQSEQLESQKDQFLAEFQVLREESRRNALLFARDVLKDAEEKALEQNPNLNSITDISTSYLNPLYITSLKVVLESSDPQEVLEQSKVWAKIEGPAIIMIKGIKSAAEIYFRAVGLEGIDYSKEPEDFVFIYSPYIEKLPYFDTYTASLHMLASFMVNIQPGRKAALLAVDVALAKATELPMKEDEIRKKIQNLRDSGAFIPKVAEDF